MRRFVNVACALYCSFLSFWFMAVTFGAPEPPHSTVNYALAMACWAAAGHFLNLAFPSGAPEDGRT